MSHKRKKTKIVATLGPAISSKEMLHKMVEAGVNVFRINFSHADYEDVKNASKTFETSMKSMVTMLPF